MYTCMCSFTTPGDLAVVHARILTPSPASPPGKTQSGNRFCWNRVCSADLTTTNNPHISSAWILDPSVTCLHHTGEFWDMEHSEVAYVCMQVGAVQSLSTWHTQASRSRYSHVYLQSREKSKNFDLGSCRWQQKLHWFRTAPTKREKKRANI